MKILVVDNYDSFTYNLAQLVASLSDAQVIVKRNDEVSVGEVHAMQPGRIIFSPGPGDPSKGGICKALLNEFAGATPILGVCLGHQIIGEFFGASVVVSHRPVHGKASVISHRQSGIFNGLPSPLSVCRYHSLVINPSTVPEDLLVTAQAQDGTVMAIQHRRFAIHGVQFHPESFLTPDGPVMINNFLSAV